MNSMVSNIALLIYAERTERENLRLVLRMLLLEFSIMSPESHFI